MSKSSLILDESSIILAKYCYCMNYPFYGIVNNKDVQDLFELYQDLKETYYLITYYL